MADDKNVTIKILYPYVLNLIPSNETQAMFNEATRNNYKLSYDEYFTETRVISDQNTQLDIGSSQNVQSPKYLIGAHQTRATADTAEKIINLLYLITSILKKIMSKLIRFDTNVIVC